MYCQHAEALPGWETSSSDPYEKDVAPAHTFMTIEKTKEIVDPALPVQRLEIVGTFTNRDIVLQIGPEQEHQIMTGK